MITPVSAVPGKPNLLLGAYDLATVGYGAEEFFVSGAASSYVNSVEADFVTRMVVLTPTDRFAFNGTVIVEWLNVSGGIDAPAVWLMAHREIARAGYAYVAVSAQRVGVEGGVSLTGADMSLKSQDPGRYSCLTHPGDAFAYDIYSQIGRLLHGGAVDGLEPKAVVAAGESQSAAYLTTYVNNVDPHAAVYDGFLVHSRFGPAAPLDGTGLLGQSSPEVPHAVPFRPDLRVPVMTVITETDLIGGWRTGYHMARRPDDELFRAWEIPGTAHEDNYTIRASFIDNGFAPLDDLAAAYAPTDQLMGQQLSYCINFAPQHHYVLQAAVDALNKWVRTGESAPVADPIALAQADPPRLTLDANGLARGGVRTPWVDVPIARTSGRAGEETGMSFLFGSGEPFDAATLSRLYPGGRSEYLERFASALDGTITAGFVVGNDREEILGLAAAAYAAHP
ncbi:MAG: alpha/beta hydrolase domain-containing protein [Mycobacterium sp.]